MDRDALQTLATQIVVVLLTFVSALITARSLGADGRGTYYLAATFAASLTQFGNAGLQSANIYHVSHDESLLPALIGNSVWMSILATGGLALIGIELAYVSHGVIHLDQVPYLWLAACYAPAATFFLVAPVVLTGVHQFRLYNLFQATLAVSNLVTNVAAALYWRSVAGFLVASVVAFWFSAIALFTVLRVRWRASFGFDRSLFKQCAGYATRAYVAGILAFLVLRCNVFVLNRFASQAELGCFSVAAQIGDGLMLFPAAVALALFPRLVRAVDRWDMLVESLRRMTPLITIACVFTALVAGPFIRIAFGAAYAPAYHLLLYMIPGIFFVSLVTMISQYLSALGFLPLQVASWGATLVVLLGASLVLTPRYHATGAVVALSLAYLVLFVLLLSVAILQHRKELSLQQAVIRG